jgi:hypothetical protein
VTRRRVVQKIKGFAQKVEEIALLTPWAFLLFIAVFVYAVVKRHELEPAEFIDAFVAAGALLIGHGIHHVARRGVGHRDPAGRYPDSALVCPATARAARDRCRRPSPAEYAPAGTVRTSSSVPATVASKTCPTNVEPSNLPICSTPPVRASVASPPATPTPAPAG